ncbi:hypothetical protein V8F33_013200 [Rhypophila sp. PSN 637]
MSNESLPTFSEMGFLEMTRPAGREEMRDPELQLPPISHAGTHQQHVSPQSLGVMTDSGSAGQPCGIYPQPVEPWGFNQHVVPSHHRHIPVAWPIEPSPETSSSNSSAGSPTTPQWGFRHDTFRQGQTPSPAQDSTYSYPYHGGQHFVSCDTATQGYPAYPQQPEHPQNGHAAHTMSYWHHAQPDVTSVSGGPPPQGYDTWELYYEHRRQLALRNHIIQQRLEQESPLQQLPEHPSSPAPQPLAQGQKHPRTRRSSYNCRTVTRETPKKMRRPLVVIENRPAATQPNADRVLDTIVPTLPDSVQSHAARPLLVSDDTSNGIPGPAPAANDPQPILPPLPDTDAVSHDDAATGEQNGDLNPDTSGAQL